MKLAALGRRCFLYAWLALVPCLVFAQSTAPPSPPLNGTAIKNIVESTADLIRREYFDSDLATQMDRSLRQWASDGHYANDSTPEALASALTTDLYSISHDKHLAVTVVPANLQGPYSGPGASQQSREETVRVSNAGVQRVELLPGNVGYLNITAFFRPEEAREAIGEAIHLLCHADALIVDMRDNQGGSVDTTATVVSYFFNSPGLPLFDVVPRFGAVQHYVTQPVSDADEKRPLYVLTSARTWSGGEALPFILQERKRAEIIGETTVGAANPSRPYKIDATFSVTIPYGRVRSAVGGGNWEGTGVKPDVEVPASESLRVAQAHALLRLLADAPAGPWHDQLQRERAKLDPGP